MVSRCRRWSKGCSPNTRPRRHSGVGGAKGRSTGRRCAAPRCSHVRTRTGSRPRVPPGAPGLDPSVAVQVALWVSSNNRHPAPSSRPSVCNGSSAVCAPVSLAPVCTPHPEGPVGEVSKPRIHPPRGSVWRGTGVAGASAGPDGQGVDARASSPPPLLDSNSIELVPRSMEAVVVQRRPWARAVGRCGPRQGGGVQVTVDQAGPMVPGVDGGAALDTSEYRMDSTAFRGRTHDVPGCAGTLLAKITHVSCTALVPGLGLAERRAPCQAAGRRRPGTSGRTGTPNPRWACDGAHLATDGRERRVVLGSAEGSGADPVAERGLVGPYSEPAPETCVE